MARLHHAVAEQGGRLRVLDQGLRLHQLVLKLLEPPLLVQALLLLVEGRLFICQDLGVRPTPLGLGLEEHHTLPIRGFTRDKL